MIQKSSTKKSFMDMWTSQSLRRYVELNKLSKEASIKWFSSWDTELVENIGKLCKEQLLSPSEQLLVINWFGDLMNGMLETMNRIVLGSEKQTILRSLCCDINEIKSYWGLVYRMRTLMTLEECLSLNVKLNDRNSFLIRTEMRAGIWTRICLVHRVSRGRHIYETSYITALPIPLHRNIEVEREVKECLIKFFEDSYRKSKKEDIPYWYTIENMRVIGLFMHDMHKLFTVFVASQVMTNETSGKFLEKIGAIAKKLGVHDEGIQDFDTLVRQMETIFGAVLFLWEKVKDHRSYA